ncbi:MAG: cytochrome c1 [Xanthobacteraceae bacterium]|jgi:ubiquinol-cytochrome c reductase cytochrome b/c1 subunit|nr:cytochrome c1 [Xanthobacteraceae bacterium]
MIKRAILALVLTAPLGAFAAPASAQDAHSTPVPPKQSWSFAGPLGKYQPAQLQRGFKIYKEVCSSCHSLSQVSFRSLADAGGPGYSPAQAAAVAAEYKIKDISDAGEPIERAGRPADRFPAPFANEKAAAAANGGVAPPDLSVMAKARTYERGFPWFLVDIFTQFQEQGPDYISALLKGYEDAPKDFQLPSGGNYNKYFAGHSIAMPKPLSDGQVTYDDGSPATLDQYSKDITAFLMWTAEPHLMARKRLGLQVMFFLLVLSGLLYFTKKKIWTQVKLHPEQLQARPPTEYKH